MMKTAEPPAANKVNFQLSHFFKFSIPLSSKQPSRKQHNGLFRLPDMFVCVIQDTDVWKFRDFSYHLIPVLYQNIFLP